MKTLVTGGIRSGKSQYAEGLIADAEQATYLATGAVPSASDLEWRARVDAHQARRPSAWTTVETLDVPRSLREAPGVVLLDSVGSWLTRQLDELDLWEDAGTDWQRVLAGRLDALVGAVAAVEHDLVVVTEEVGLSLVSEHRSGRIFADWIGTANQRLAAVCDQVVLLVAGCPLVIKGAATPTRRRP